MADVEMNSDITVGRNGYLLVYMSNEDNHTVSMDNFLVTYSKGQLLEEQHYYPHGLVVQDGKNSPLVNRYLYQGKQLQKEAGMELYDFQARQYDPQIGRFWGIDPADQFPSGYTGMANDPANMIDPSGMVANGFTASGPYHGNVDFMDRSNPFNDGSFAPIGEVNPMLWLYFEYAKRADLRDSYILSLNEIATKTMQGGAIEFTRRADAPTNYLAMAFDKRIAPILYTGKPFNTVHQAITKLKPYGIDVWHYEKQTGAGLIFQFGIRKSMGYVHGSLDFIQTVLTNNPLAGRDFVNVDSDPNDPRYPYYLDNVNYARMSAENGYELAFSDVPARGLANNFYWVAETTIVKRNGSGGIIPIVTFTWGYAIDNYVMKIQPITILNSPDLNRQWINYIQNHHIK